MTIYRAMAGGVMLMLIGVLVASALYYFIIPGLKQFIKNRQNSFHEVNKKMAQREKENSIAMLGIAKSKKRK